MSWSNIDEWADMNAKAIVPEGPETGFSEAFGIGVGEMFDEMSTFSSQINNDQRDQRDEYLRELNTSGDIPDEIMSQFSQRTLSGDWRNYDLIADWAIEQGMDVQTGEEVDAARNEVLAERRQYREQALENTTWGGDIGYFGGVMTGGALDLPAVVATMAVPVVGGAARTSLAMRTLSMAGKSAAANAVGAAAVEPFIHGWKGEIGAKYGAADSVANILIAAGIGGTMTGVGTAFGGFINGNLKAAGAPEWATKDYDSLATSLRRAGMPEDEVEDIVTAAKHIDQTAEHHPDMDSEKFFTDAEDITQATNKPKGNPEEPIMHMENDALDEWVVKKIEFDKEATFMDIDGNMTKLSEVQERAKINAERAKEIEVCISG